MFKMDKRSYKVAEITDLIKQTLESHFYDLQIEGEISNFRPSSTGHYYFTLKDKDAVISVVMFKNRIGSLKFIPADGKLVTIKGNLSVYAKRGSYQIICESMEKAGEGDILAMLEERKRKLSEEGLFESINKKQLPLFPSKIAVITSPTGAALKDILRVTGRRNAGMDIVILPAPVQGAEASEKLSAQIKRANDFNMGEVIIIGRGGGSLEDLLPFSEETLVRAVAASEIPVISAVGHEIDISLSDLAADFRAPTPSAAAEIVCQNRTELLSRVREIYSHFISLFNRQTERIRILLKQFSKNTLEKTFRAALQPFFIQLDDEKEGLIRKLQNRLKDTRHKVTLLASNLTANSPEIIMAKGYSIVTDPDTNKILKKASETEPGKNINISFASGKAEAEIKEVINEKL